MIEWLFDTMVVNNYEILLLVGGWVVTGVIALIWEYKYLDIRKKRKG